jgi:hypothetical protein
MAHAELSYHNERQAHDQFFSKKHSSASELALTTQAVAGDACQACQAYNFCALFGKSVPLVLLSTEACLV